MSVNEAKMALTPRAKRYDAATTAHSDALLAHHHALAAARETRAVVKSTEDEMNKAEDALTEEDRATLSRYITARLDGMFPVP